MRVARGEIGLKFYHLRFWASWCAYKVLQRRWWQEVLPMAVVLVNVELLLGRADLLASRKPWGASSIWSDTLPCCRGVSQGSLASSMCHLLLSCNCAVQIQHLFLPT